jgi:hypothetical protein
VLRVAPARASNLADSRQECLRKSPDEASYRAKAAETLIVQPLSHFYSVLFPRFCSLKADIARRSNPELS